jgi:hypothetical protein
MQTATAIAGLTGIVFMLMLIAVIISVAIV